jgi:CRP-like cAMP-binding protein
MAYDLNHMQATLTPLISPLKALLPESLQAQCVSSTVKKGTLLFQTGKKPQWMFYVMQGEVTLERHSAQGDPVVLQRTQHGFVSEASLQSPKYHCDGRVVANSEIIQIPLSALADALNSDSAFAARWIRMLNQEVKRLRLQCERLSMKSVKDRVLHLIHTEGKNSQYQVTTGLKSLAGELGVTHEALYRTLAALEQSREIKRENGLLKLIQ